VQYTICLLTNTVVMRTVRRLAFKVLNESQKQALAALIIEWADLGRLYKLTNHDGMFWQFSSGRWRVWGRTIIGGLLNNIILWYLIQKYYPLFIADHEDNNMRAVASRFQIFKRKQNTGSATMMEWTHLGRFHNIQHN